MDVVAEVAVHEMRKKVDDGQDQRECENRDQEKMEQRIPSGMVRVRLWRFGHKRLLAGRASVANRAGERAFFDIGGNRSIQELEPPRSGRFTKKNQSQSLGEPSWPLWFAGFSGVTAISQSKPYNPSPERNSTQS
jgi:hypothetical protein